MAPKPNLWIPEFMGSGRDENTDSHAGPDVKHTRRRIELEGCSIYSSIQDRVDSDSNSHSGDKEVGQASKILISTALEPPEKHRSQVQNEGRGSDALCR